MQQFNIHGSDFFTVAVLNWQCSNPVHTLSEFSQIKLSGNYIVRGQPDAITSISIYFCNWWVCHSLAKIDEVNMLHDVENLLPVVTLAESIKSAKVVLHFPRTQNHSCVR